MKGPCSRIDLMKQHAGIDVQAMYPAGAPPKADQWTYDTFLKRPRKTTAGPLMTWRKFTAGAIASAPATHQVSSSGAAMSLVTSIRTRTAPPICASPAHQRNNFRKLAGKMAAGCGVSLQVRRSPIACRSLLLRRRQLQYSSVRARRTPTASLRSGSTQPQTRRAPVSGPRSLTSGSQESRQSTS